MFLVNISEQGEAIAVRAKPTKSEIQRGFAMKNL